MITFLVPDVADDAADMFIARNSRCNISGHDAGADLERQCGFIIIPNGTDDAAGVSTGCRNVACSNAAINDVFVRRSTFLDEADEPSGYIGVRAPNVCPARNVAHGHVRYL